MEEGLEESRWPRVAATNLSPFCGEFVILDTCLDYQDLGILLQGRAHTQRGPELLCGTDTLLKAQMPPQCQLKA
ncbi:RIKEN cDNA A530095I07 [Mus musculus]|nr:RIKEN cDNA A530095I07 [Mus musculus]